MTTETLYATSLTSGAVATSGNALGAVNGVFTTDTGNVSWTARFALGDPSGTQANGTHTITLRVRKESTQSGAPTVTSITLYAGGVSLGAIGAGNWSVTSGTGQDVSATFAASLLSGRALSGIDVEIVVTGAGGSPSARTTVQLDAITWSGDFTTPPQNFSGSAGLSGAGTLAASGVPLTGGVISYAATVQADSPEGYWRLDDSLGAATAVDATAAHNLAVTGGVTFGGTGPLLDGATDTMAVFNGTTGYLSAAWGATFPTVFTLEAWCRLDSTASTSCIVQLYQASATATRFGLFARSGTGNPTDTANAWGIFDNVNLANNTSGVVLAADGTWHHLVVTINGTTWKFYHDGVLVRTTTVTNAAGTTYDTFRIGTSSTGTAWMSGGLDEVAYFPDRKSVV